MRKRIIVKQMWDKLNNGIVTIMKRQDIFYEKFNNDYDGNVNYFSILL